MPDDLVDTERRAPLPELRDDCSALAARVSRAQHPAHAHERQRFVPHPHGLTPLAALHCTLQLDCFADVRQRYGIVLTIDADDQRTRQCERDRQPQRERRALPGTRRHVDRAAERAQAAAHETVLGAR